ncbi:MAG: DNA mismatch repair protein MutS [Clostridiales Family XIII bacterium]|jgi:DNA mismatch repair protein MutS|nr:DNA mismatch repair protein MutS [Clostridiales Family XIII bacterium]
MLQQYLSVKERYKDCILFFRLGDFYEMFYDDAITASRILGITLTKKTVGGGFERAPLCGVPYLSADTYIAKLIAEGYKVAVCEQIEDPKLVTGLVKRDVVRVITPGTVTGDSMLNARDNNYLACVTEANGSYGLVWCDISTGELNAAAVGGRGRDAALSGQLALIDAREIIVVTDETPAPAFRDALDASESPAEAQEGIGKAAGAKSAGSFLEKLTEDYNSAFVSTLNFRDARSGRALFEKQFGSSAARTRGMDADGAAALALYALFFYLEKTQKQELPYMRPPLLRNLTDHMLLDRASVRSLELTETLFDRNVKGSLLGVLDMTRTAMGGRLIRKWLKEPLTDVAKIERRLCSVDALMSDVLARNNVKEHLKAVYDIERLAGRVSYGNANARDLLALLRSLNTLPDVKDELEGLNAPLLTELGASMDDFTDARELIERALADEPPFTVREGGLIRDGYSDELDALKDSIKDGQEWLAGLEATERERTGITNLKVGFNKVYGYYINITNSNKNLVPPDYIRKQTLVNAERYTTIEMKETESVVLGAEARINEMEYDLFNKVRLDLQIYIPALQRTSEALATLDVLLSFAEASSKYGYVRPTVDDGEVIEIERGRHPVIERTLTTTVFVPNDVYMDRSERSMLLITGPNMAGKSTYMRQTALIVLMAQAGCFTPADRARIGVADRLYTRIGAADNLARGESTFFVEMSELAYILNTATERSLVILDEIGRGTSTYDGLAIAWAVVDYLCGGEGGSSTGGTRVRTMFATHYHELTSIEGKTPGLINLNTETADTGDDVVFLHRIAEGPANRSYGIHVAKLAGVPQSLLDDAQSKLDRLEGGGETRVPHTYGGHESFEEAAASTPASRSAKSSSGNSPKAGSGAPVALQLDMFSFAPNPIVERLKSIDLMETTPSRAFAILEELKEAAENE